MLLTEFLQDMPAGYQDQQEDGTTLDLEDTRKTRLTLAHLNRLRLANDVRKFENEQKSTEIVSQYSAAAGGEGGAEVPAI